MFNVIQRSLKKNCINAWLVYNLLSNRPVSYLAFGYFKSDTLNSILKSAHFKNKNCSNINKNILIREIHTSNISKAKKKKNEIYDNSLVLIREFENVEKKNKTAFLDMIRVYDEKFQSRFRHVDFINAALNQMQKYGVHEDLEVYKALLDIFPKGKYIPQTYFMGEMWFFPEQVDCGLEILEKMEHNGVYPDVEIKELLLNIYGRKSLVYRKFCEMMYWLPKFRNASPWPLPKDLSNDVLELAKAAVKRITSVDAQTEINVYQTEEVKESIDKTWIVSAQSKEQIKLLNKHDPKKPVIVEGGDRVYLRKNSINYFVLKSDEDPPKDEPPPDIEENLSKMDTPCFNPLYKYPEKKTVHEQDYETIYAVCATGTSSKDSLLSWVRILQDKENPILGELTVLFRFKTPLKEPVPIVGDVVKTDA